MQHLDKAIDQIRDIIPQAALYEQLAEECVELAKACLKKARKIRNENYTPVSMKEIDASLEEELADVLISSEACGLKINTNIMNKKIKRWIKRNKKEDKVSDAIKIPTAYRYYISVLTIANTLVRLGYNPESMMVSNGWWDIPICFGDKRISGIGFFESAKNQIPSIVIDISKQRVYICDKRHLDEVHIKHQQNVAILEFDFGEIFEAPVTWEMLKNRLNEGSAYNENS